jgi:hypothetical protein
MLVRPEDAIPQISVRAPRGNPPVNSSISRMPLETISNGALHANWEAGRMAESLGARDRLSKTSLGHGLLALRSTIGKLDASAVRTRWEAMATSKLRAIDGTIRNHYSKT